MMIEKHVFCSRATQREERSRLLSPTVIPISSDMLPIKLRLFNLSGCIIGEERDLFYGMPHLVTETQMSVPLSRLQLSYQNQPGYRKVMAGYLSRMGIPEEEQLAIIANIFEVVDEAVPRLPITVVIVDVTVRTAQNVSLSGRQVMIMIRGSTWESMERYGHVGPMVKYYLAVYEALEYVSLDSLEGATRQTLCFLCKETLDHHFVTVKEEGSSEDHLEKKIARLSCSHLYHRSCIFMWLLTSHLCPFCRHPLVDEAPEFLRKDMMLPMCSSARGDTFVEKIIMEAAKLWEGKLRKKISKLAPFSFFLISVFVGYRLLWA